MWRVEDLAGGVLTARPIDDLGARPQQFLYSLEQVHPGVIPDPRMTELGEFALQRLFLQALRLDALHGTAPFLAMQRSAVIPVEYQLVPLVMALRQDPVRLLIADTVGVGKTIEAGLIVSELFARARARSLLVITPAGLREQWQEQLRNLFYIDAEIISTDTRRRLERAIPPGADPWLYYDRLIVSIDYAKDSGVLPEILKREPPWDIVLVDEAHNCAMPHRQQGRSAEMDRWKAAHRIAGRCRHLILLTATPHNGYTDSYSSLLRMLSAKCTEGTGWDLRPNREQASRHVCQRTRKHIEEWCEQLGTQTPFPRREDTSKTEVAVDLHPSHRRLLQAMSEQLRHVVALAKRKQAAKWLELHLHRRGLSSPEALRASLENRIQRIQARTTSLDDDTHTEVESLQGSLLDAGPADVGTENDLDRRADCTELGVDMRVELGYLTGLLEKAKTITPQRDEKLKVLRDSLLPSLLQEDEHRTFARVIVFTRYKDTLDYLEQELRKHAPYEVLSLHGDLSPAKRKEVFERFGTAATAVLLATDVISEGLNLQTIACKVVHYDLPWNPNRLDQREGRVDRFGQKAKMVYTRLLFCKDSSDEDVMDLYLRKYMRMRADQGFSPPFRASEDTVLRVLMRRRERARSGADQASLFEQENEEELLDDDRNRRALAEGFYGQTNVRITDVSDRLRQAHRIMGEPSRIASFIIDGLRRNNCSVEEHDGILRVDLANPRLRVPGVPTVIEKAIVDPALSEMHPEAVVLDVGHPLIRRLDAVIREQAMSDESEGGRTAAFVATGASDTKLLGHGLLRAIAKTKPPALLEELLVFGLRASLDGITILTRDEAEKAAEAIPAPHPLPRQEALERARALKEHELWTQARERAITEGLRSLIEYRRRFLQELRQSSEGEWLEGFDDVEFVGLDLYCLTLILPEPK